LADATDRFMENGYELIPMMNALKAFREATQ